jgi:hypothetical protein
VWSGVMTERDGHLTIAADTLTYDDKIL